MAIHGGAAMSMLSITKSPPHITFFPFQTQHRHHHRRQSLCFVPPRSSKTSDNPQNPATDDYDDEQLTLPPEPSPPGTVEIRFKRGSRRRRKQLEEDAQQPLKVKAKAPPKDWDSMTLAEKAIEIYVGEKGILFWLNKFAYASIFIIIGGWILFRFVGPALNLYQLDTPPLSPSSILKGS